MRRPEAIGFDRWNRPTNALGLQFNSVYPMSSMVGNLKSTWTVSALIRTCPSDLQFSVEAKDRSSFRLSLRIAPHDCAALETRLPAFPCSRVAKFVQASTSESTTSSHLASATASP